MNRGLLVLAYSLAVAIATAKEVRSEAAQQCAVDQRRPAQHVFGRADQKHPWRQYRRIEDVPELDLEGGMAAQVWDRRDGFLVRTVEPGEDFWAYTQYCFDSRQKLRLLRFELRTAWGWGYRVKSLVENGILTHQHSEFFSTDTEEPIPKPQDADNIPEALQPTVYADAKQLPFAKLLLRR